MAEMSLTQTCDTCGIEKTYYDFPLKYPKLKNNFEILSICRDCRDNTQLDLALKKWPFRIVKLNTGHFISTSGRASSRLKRYQTPGSHTIQEWKELCEKYGNCCLRCGKVKRLTVDHVIPISKGGSNDISNIQPLCKSCNSSKGATFADYRNA